MARQLTRTRTAPVDTEPAEEDDEYSMDESEEETKPRRSRSHAKDEDEETTTRTRHPAGKRSARRSEPSKGHAVRKGWKGAKENKGKRQTGDEFRVKENVSYLIHFLEPEPFAAYLEHFIKELANNQERASFVCLEEDCPLDGIGDKTGDRALFNIALIDEETGNATVMWWKATSSILDIIEDYAESERNSPIDRDDLYFEVSKKKGKNNFFQYKIDPIRARDLADDGMEPLSDEELDGLREELFDDTVLKVSTRKELREIAEDLED